MVIRLNSYRCLMKFSLLATLFFWTLTVLGQKGPDFYWSWRIVGDSVIVTGKCAGAGAGRVAVGKAATLQSFARIYRIVDALDYERLGEYKAHAKNLSAKLVKPFAAALSKCGRMIVTLDTGLLALGIEFLATGSQPLALYRPLLFRINTGKVVEEKKLRLHKGFILRDTSADPENACRTVQQAYPNSVLRSAHGLAASAFRLPAGIDFAVLSTHGLVDSATGKGLLFLDKDLLPAGSLAAAPLDLLYIDACQQAASRSVTSALSHKATGTYYIAPLVSNDSGESSTRTMTGFFNYLKVLGDATGALWHTRRDLAAHYRKWKSLDVVNMSYIFRVYLL
jgi:hypothetical protein